LPSRLDERGPLSCHAGRAVDDARLDQRFAQRQRLVEQRQHDGVRDVDALL